eukprot:477539-Rhodomonas_salina.2
MLLSGGASGELAARWVCCDPSARRGAWRNQSNSHTKSKSQYCMHRKCSGLPFAFALGLPDT